MTQINAYLNFDGNCREAMNFYKDCLDANLDIQTVGESAMAPQCPTATHGQVMHASLSKGALLIMGSDMIRPDKYQKGNSIALAVNCSSEEEINTFFSKLSEGGEVDSPLKTEFWGAVFGEITDKFGVRWMLNFMKEQNG